MPKTVGLVTHPDCSLHTSDGHPEFAGRTRAIEKHFQEIGLISQLVPITAREATLEELALNHDRSFVKRIGSIKPRGIQFLDADTYFNEHSWHAARLSYGGAILAVDKVMQGEIDRAFCCLRPPGHHAENAESMGFCIFNNIAGAARFALTKHGLSRVAIFDFDVHHGNGTQSAFYEDNSVYFTSLHQWPFYPGTGAATENGNGRGRGYTMNFPLNSGTTGKQAIELVESRFRKAME